MIVSGYPIISFKSYDYMRLFDGNFIRRSNAGRFLSVYEKVITVDTETYVYSDKQIGFITDWTITIENDCCIYGNHVSDLLETIDKILYTLHADKEHIVRFYIHNFPYDYMFLRNHMFEKWGEPDKCLASKAHRYIFMDWTGQGLEFRDSQILTQRSLERLCKDMGTTEKAVGAWDYKKFRTPDSGRTTKEITYVCTDTIALCKALRKYISDRGYTVANVPLTNTGFIRSKARSLSRKDKKWRKKFLDIQLDLIQYKQLVDSYHGGYTHANRYFVNRVIREKMQCYDFASSYPARLIYEKYPMTNFVYTDSLTLSDIIDLKDDYAFSGYIRLKNVRLKKDCPMPPMAFHKAKVCVFPDKDVKSKKTLFEENLDNGKIVNADTVIYPFTDPDLEAILECYDYDWADVANVMRAKKEYIPEWLISYIMDLYFNKSTLKHADPVLYMISKGELNGVYGMMVQKIIQQIFEEDFENGEWSNKLTEDKEQELLEKFYRSRNSFLPYQFGVWVTAYAQRELFKLGKCCKVWIYSDTDSVKGYDWDMDALKAYNDEIIRISEERKLGLVEYNGEKFRLGIADFDGEYLEFKTMGSKRYCFREKREIKRKHIKSYKINYKKARKINKKGVLKITVAGVPKDGIYCLDDDINNFSKGFIFRNNRTFKRNFKKFNPDAEPKWKLKTEYIYVKGVKKMQIEESKIEYGCSIRLSDTEYELDHTIPYDSETGLPLKFELDNPVFE